MNERNLGGEEATRAFFDRPAEEVAAEISTFWMNHENRSEVHQGQGKILAIVTPFGTRRLFRISQVYVYSNEYTFNRWPSSRAPEIDSMQPGELISYVSRSATLTFIKTRGAENIQLDHLWEEDKYGDPLRNPDSELGSSGVAKVAGLGHKDRSHLELLNLREEQGFLLIHGSQMLSEEELRRIEAEILGDYLLPKEELERIEREILDDAR